MLRFLGEEKYDEVMAVLGSFPHITMETKLQGNERRGFTSVAIIYSVFQVIYTIFVVFLSITIKCWTMKTVIT